MNVYDSIFAKDNAISFFSRSSFQVAVTGLTIGCIRMGLEGRASIGAGGGNTVIWDGGASLNEAILRLSPADNTPDPDPSPDPDPCPEERPDTTLPNDFEGGGGGGGGGGSAVWLAESLEGRLPHLALSLCPII